MGKFTILSNLSKQVLK